MWNSTIFEGNFMTTMDKQAYRIKNQSAFKVSNIKTTVTVLLTFLLLFTVPFAVSAQATGLAIFWNYFY